MRFSVLMSLFLSFLLLGIAKHLTAAAVVSFDENYVIRYGNDHVLKLDNGARIQLSLDLASGAGFKSKVGYGSGFFEMNIKLPANHSPGVVTTFYLTSNPDNQPGNHDELDFEFLGSDGPPYTLQTNVFANDNGGREQKLHLWFDPTTDFHKYGILWNHHQVVFFVDDTPIRVYKNYKKFGARYTTQNMFAEGSIWNGESWASNGRKVDWSKAPFQANYQGFNINGCQFGGKCYSRIFYWNRENYWELTPIQQRAYEDVRKKYVYSDYCSQKRRYYYKECQVK